MIRSENTKFRRVDRPVSHPLDMRVTFRLSEGHVLDVDYVDYH